ncbi:MAG: hypothetical protein H6613_19755 [Ignavibacteriales bacterium]|nr:hypothetical protein [Ignavibacteriales bacterium]
MGAILLFLGHLINTLINGGAITLAGQSLIFAAHSLLVLAFIGIYNKYFLTLGRTGTIGVILSIIGSIAVCSIVFVEIAQASMVDTTAMIFNAPIINYIHSIGPLLFVFGLIFFGIAILKLQSILRWAGAVLLFGNFVFIAGSFLASLSSVTSIFGAFFTASGFIWLGYSLIDLKKLINKTFWIFNCYGWIK